MITNEEFKKGLDESYEIISKFCVALKVANKDTPELVIGMGIWKQLANIEYMLLQILDKKEVL